MTDAVQAVLGLWDRVILLAEQAEAADWGRPTPDPEMTIRDVVTHVAGPAARLAGPDAPPAELLDALRRARDAAAHRLDHHPGSPRATGAACLDLYVHAHDVAAGLGVPVDLDDDSPAVAEACRYLLGLAPALSARAGAAGLRVGLPGTGTGGLWLPAEAEAEAEARAITAEAETREITAEAETGAITATPAAFVLLLAGRGDPRRWRDRGALDWSGAAGEAFVTKARLYA
jgi:hypothetical protein